MKAVARRLSQNVEHLWLPELWIQIAIQDPVCKVVWAHSLKGRGGGGGGGGRGWFSDDSLKGPYCSA